ncbi:MAG: ABC transporter ATP-binding protein [Xanthomonadales bacterium]|nr:ABC transporter ATP-binding protein [Xanthomonadales bacterium]ODU93232.1 MAG: ABC transporter ATP-binding protein [Rhodanobacter sp. SCN 66-43]OJY82320.1 MAG: ABC transporter ATP-binding protein [Xanthomonadales bacterium 66-474]
MPIIGRAGAVRASAYVVLSLIAALLGSIAAIVLVPLIQSGHAPMFGGQVLVLPAGAGVLASIFVASIGSHVLLRWIVSGLGARIISDCAMRLRGRVHARLIDADVVALNGLTSAEIANVLTANVELATQGVGAMLQLWVAGVTTAVNLAFAFWVSPVLTLILPALAGLGLVALRWNGREQSRVSRQYVEDTTRLFWFSEDFPRRLRHVRSFEREGAERAGYGAVSARLAHAYRRQIELTASGKLVVELLAIVGMAGMFLIAGRWHGVDQASWIAVGLLLGRLLPYMASTRHNFQQLRLAVPAFELWQRYANLDRVRSPMQPATAVRGTTRCVHIERVRVQFPSLRLDVEDLVLTPGEMTLIAGDSGIGKTSLVDVLAGMTAPVFFAARSNGHFMDFDGYRQLVRKGAYLSQSIRPWQRTVRECLLWAAPDSSDECLHAVLADVGLGARLHGTRDGLDLELQGSSCRLSGGELQRLLLVQVILRQPFIAVLDEATGALDADSEMNVLAVLKRRLPQTILIVVSHRQGPFRIADQCLRIGRGGIAAIVRANVSEVGDARLDGLVQGRDRAPR